MSDLVSGPRGRHLLYRLAELSDESGELARAMMSLEMRLAPSDDSTIMPSFQPLGFFSRLFYRIDDEDGTFSLRFPRLGLPSLWSPVVWLRSRRPVRSMSSWSARAVRGPGFDSEKNLVTPAGIAARIDTLPGSSDLELLSQALEISVSSAMYWQEPEMVDRILDNPVIIASLAAFETRSGLTPTMIEKLSAGEELSIEWIMDLPIVEGEQGDAEADVVLDRWALNTMANVKAAERERPTDPTANWSGNWFSTPPYGLVSSNRQAPDGVPAGLRYVEDGSIWERAVIRKITAEAHMFVIDSVTDWVRLCDAYPLDVTAEVRHDWYRTTGRDSTWIIPNWRDVARDWGAVRMTINGYLTSATKAIRVRDGESMIAGWNPGQTYWLTDVEQGLPETWIQVDYDHWERAEE